jgi:curved DNA-binding protein CbpA
MGLPGGADPFTALGLPARAGLSDDDVRSAWRRVATVTHPDRADGGDPVRFAMAAAAYTVLRTRSGRGEALADLASSPGPRRARPVPPPGRAPTPPRSGADASAARSQAAAPAGPAPAGPGPAGGGPATTLRPPATWRARLGGARLLSRIGRGRPALLALRVLIAAAVAAVAVAVDGFQPATPALITGALTWLLLTAPHDLAP